MVDNLLARLARVRPSLLGEEFTAASAVGQTTPDRDALARACIEATLRTALTWFGMVTWGNAPMGEAVQLTDVGWWLLGRGREPALPPFGATPLAIQPDLTVLVLNAEPAHLWPLLALAEAETLDRVSAYRITAASLRGALRRGLAFDQVIRFLESRTGGPLPDAVRVTLDDWVRAVRRVVLESRRHPLRRRRRDPRRGRRPRPRARRNCRDAPRWPRPRPHPARRRGTDRLAERGGPHAGLEAAAGVCQSPRIVATMGCNSASCDLREKGLI